MDLQDVLRRLNMIEEANVRANLTPEEMRREIISLILDIEAEIGKEG